MPKICIAGVDSAKRTNSCLQNGQKVIYMMAFVIFGFGLGTRFAAVVAPHRSCTMPHVSAASRLVRNRSTGAQAPQSLVTLQSKGVHFDSLTMILVIFVVTSNLMPPAYKIPHHYQQGDDESPVAPLRTIM